MFSVCKSTMLVELKIWEGGMITVLGSKVFNPSLQGRTEHCEDMSQTWCMRIICSTVSCSVPCNGILSVVENCAFSGKVLHSLKFSWKEFLLCTVQSYSLCLSCLETHLTEPPSCDQMLAVSQVRRRKTEVKLLIRCRRRIVFANGMHQSTETAF